MKCIVCKTPMRRDAKPCLGCGADIKAEVPRPPAGWKSMDSAPLRATRVKVILPDGKTYSHAHFAMDLNGEEQPPFIGWFIPGGAGFVGIPTPVGWRPILKTRTNHGAAIQL